MNQSRTVAGVGVFKIIIISNITTIIRIAFIARKAAISAIARMVKAQIDPYWEYDKKWQFGQC